MIKDGLVCRRDLARDRPDFVQAVVDAVMAGWAQAFTEPEEAVQTVIEALREERFLVLPHPSVAEYIKRKTSDYDRWLHGMRRLQDRYLEAQDD